MLLSAALSIIRLECFFHPQGCKFPFKNNDFRFISITAGRIGAVFHPDN
jgi:hypothetical protein